MGEYIEYGDEVFQIGVADDLNYISYQKYYSAYIAGKISRHWTSNRPDEYLNPKEGYRFRFPFPDEDKLPFGQFIETNERKLDVIVNPDISSAIANEFRSTGKLQITQQKLIEREPDGEPILALVVTNPETGNSYSIGSLELAKKIVEQIRKNHVLRETDQVKKQFFQQISKRIQDGYYPSRLSLPKSSKKVIKRRI